MAEQRITPTACMSLVALSLSACATPQPERSVVAADSVETDVRNYVLDDWPSFERRLRWSTRVPEGKLEFVEFGDLKCQTDHLMHCDFQLTARTESGQLVSGRVSGTFGYDEGKLGEYIIVG